MTSPSKYTVIEHENEMVPAVSLQLGQRFFLVHHRAIERELGIEVEKLLVSIRMLVGPLCPGESARLRTEQNATCIRGFITQK